MRTSSAVLLVIGLVCCAASAPLAQFVKMGTVKYDNEDYYYFNNVVFTPDNLKGFVTDFKNDRVIVFDPRRSSGNVLTTVATGSGPAGIFLTPDGQRACVINVNENANLVTIIRTSDYSTTTVSGLPLNSLTVHNNIAFTTDSKYGIVCNSSYGANRVYIFSVSDGIIRSTLDVGAIPMRTYVSPAGDRAFVLCLGNTITSNSQVGVIKLSNFTVEQVFTLTDTTLDLEGTDGICLNNLVFAPDGSRAYLCDPRYNDVMSFDIPIYTTQHYQLTGESPANASLSRIAISPDGQYLIASSIVTNRIYVLSAANLINNTASIIWTMADPDGIADWDGYNNIITMANNTTAFIGSVGSNELVQFNYITGSFIVFFQTGSNNQTTSPETISLSSGEHFLTTVNLSTDNITLFVPYPKAINIPYLQVGSSEFTGYGVSNPSGDPFSILAYAMTTDGKIMTGTANPTYRVLEPYSQLPFIGDQFFGLPTTSANGWIQLFANSDEARCFFLDTNTTGDYMDGTVASDTLFTDFYMTHVNEHYAAGTYQVKMEVYLVNTYNSSIYVDLTLKNTAGQTVASLSNKEIKAGSIFSGSLRELFYSHAGTVDVSSGYITGHVRNSYGVAGFAMVRYFNTQGDCVTVHTIPLTSDSRVSKLYCPHLANGGAGYNTTFNIINTSSQAAHITMTFYHDDGSAPSTAQTDLATGAQFSDKAWRIFGLADPSTMPAYVTGSVVVTSDKTGVVGDVIFGDGINATPLYETSLALEQNTYSQCVFSHVANGPSGGGVVYYNGLSVFNPGTQAIQVGVKVYKESGQLTGFKNITLQPNTRLVRLLNDPDLIPAAWPQLGGYVVLESSSQFIAFELFTDGSSKMLSAVPRN